MEQQRWNLATTLATKSVGLSVVGSYWSLITRIHTGRLLTGPMPSYLFFLVVAVAAIRITRSFIPIYHHHCNKRAASATTRSIFILKAQLLSLQTIEIARQSNPVEYERLLRATIPTSDTIIRWYIAKFTKDFAIIEVVVERES